jgi:hypothetical protein
MPDYDVADFQGLPPSRRFPDWIIGSGLWREYGDGRRDTIRRLLTALILSRLSANWGSTPLKCPRLFISHRQVDAARAHQVATVARAAGFQVWIDVEDPSLVGLAMSGATLTDDDVSLLTAAIIETALLNSTHVIALITTNTPGSKWVPYEYGRAKDSSMYSLQAACWIEAGVLKKDLGEYLLLGVTTKTDAEIKDWLDDELKSWNQQFGSCTGGADAEDAQTPPPARPSDADPDLDTIVQEMMAGLERPMVVRGPLRLKQPLHPP